MTDGQSSSGLADDTALVKIYPPQRHKEEWQEEAEERDWSTSRYCQELIQEARFLRDEGQLKLGDRRKVVELKERIDELEAKQANRTEVEPDRASLLSRELVRTVLTDHYQGFDAVLESLLESDEFQRLVRRELESALYSLGEQGDAVFRRGKGWKLINRGESNG